MKLSNTATSKSKNKTGKNQPMCHMTKKQITKYIFYFRHIKKKNDVNIVQSEMIGVQTLLPETVHTKIAYTGKNLSSYVQIKYSIISIKWCIMQGTVVSYAVKIR